MSQHNLVYSKNILKEVADLPPKHFKQVMTKMLSLVHFPFPQDSKMVKGYNEVFRVDSGEYRIVYRVDGDNVIIEMIGKRNDDEIYRLLARKFNA